MVVNNTEFKVHGKTYAERKEYVRNIAGDFNLNEIGSISWGELCDIQRWFEKQGKRYGLLQEFKENRIC